MTKYKVERSEPEKNQDFEQEVGKKSPDKTEETKEKKELILEEEPNLDPYANLLESAPELPTNFNEVIKHPVGPLAGNGKNKGKEPLMPLYQMVDFVKETLPPIPEDADEIYLDKWFKAYRYLFAQDYPDPDEIIIKLKFSQFGNPKIEDTRFQFKEQVNVLIILDVSGSMANTIDGKSMMEIAKDSIRQFTSDLPKEANVGLRVYGHEGKRTGKTKEQSCQSTDLVYNIQPLDTQEFNKIITSFEPTGWTPIGLSLEKAKNDFANFPGEENTNIVYIVSDGAETCGGDPVATAQELTESNIQPIINVIGFNVDMEGQSHLREIAETGGGIYSNAGDENELHEAFQQAKELLKQWKEWKLDTEKDVNWQMRQQKNDAVRFRSSWFRYTYDEEGTMTDVLFELKKDEYLGGNIQYLYDKSRKHWEVFLEFGEEAQDYLYEEIENNYKEIIDNIYDEYNKNVNDG